MNLLDQFKQIKLFVFDIDGVLTDGSLLIFENNFYVRKMNIKDGYALQLAVKKGYDLLVISGGDAEPVKQRLQKLGIRDVFLKVLDKKQMLSDYVKGKNLTWQEVVYMGDDIPDYEVMKLCGMPCCPSDAAPEIRSIAKYISHRKGGEGAVRDVLEKVMKLNGDWEIDTSIASK